MTDVAILDLFYKPMSEWDDNVLNILMKDTQREYNKRYMCKANESKQNKELKEELAKRTENIHRIVNENNELREENERLQLNLDTIKNMFGLNKIEGMINLMDLMIELKKKD